LQNAAVERYFTGVRSITVIGGGRIGGSLAIALSRAGHTVDELVFRSDRYLNALIKELPLTTRFRPERDWDSVESDIAIIASGDPEISGIAERMARFDRLPRIALHTSGSLSSAELLPLAEKGVHTASLHPLAAVSDPLTGRDRFRGAYFCAEGDDEAVHIAKALAEDLGGHSFSIRTEAKSLYHAAAVISAGHVVALLDAAIEMMTRCGLSPEEARQVLVPLASGSLANLSDRTPAAALTGPYARGDKEALERHLEAFSASGIGSEIVSIYLGLAARSAEIMLREGHDVAELRNRILIAKREAE
jgi:predicted short-subunit dehydrogenase-like oxidoreductase (DUF2520 family)